MKKPRLLVRDGVPRLQNKVGVLLFLFVSTEIRQPWLLSVEPHDSETVARLCCACDGDLAADEGAVGADPILAEVLTCA